MPIVPGQVVHATIAEGRRSGWMTPMEVRGGQCPPYLCDGQSSCRGRAVNPTIAKTRNVATPPIT